MATPATAATGDLFDRPCANGSGPGCADGRLPGSPQRIVFSPDRKSAYVMGGNGFAVFDRDLRTGALTQKAGTAGCFSSNGQYGDNTSPLGQCTIARGIGVARWAAVSPDGRNVYFGGNRVAIFNRNTATGALTQPAGLAGCVAGPSGAGACVQARVELLGSVVMSPDGRQLYVGTDFGGGGVAVLNRNSVTGALAQPAGPGGCIVDGGDGVTCADGGGLGAPRELTMSFDGENLYLVSSRGEGALTTLDRNPAGGGLTQRQIATACITQTGEVPCAGGRALGGAGSVAVAPDGRSVLVASLDSDAIAVFDRNVATGVLNQKTGIAGCISETGNPVGSPPSYACRDAEGLTDPGHLALSPDGLSVYMVTRIPRSADDGANTALTWLDRDPIGGALSPGGCVAHNGSGGLCQLSSNWHLLGGSTVAVGPEGREVYLGTNTSRTVIFGRELAPDADVDGIPDVLDACPARPGPASARGCPVAGPEPRPSNRPGAAAAAFRGCPALTANVIRGSAAANTITGTVRGDRIFVGAGDDVVDALGGNDCIDLGAGRDRARGGPGRDLLLGDLGNDRLRGDTGDDSISGSRGRDAITGGAGSDRISGGSAGDRISGGSGRDRIAAGSGNDRISARDGKRDKINCGSGRDAVIADRGDRIARNCERSRRR